MNLDELEADLGLLAPGRGGPLYSARFKLEYERHELSPKDVERVLIHFDGVRSTALGLIAEIRELREALKGMVDASIEVLDAESNHNTELDRRAGFRAGYRLINGQWQINSAMHALCNVTEVARAKLEAMRTETTKGTKT